MRCRACAILLDPDDNYCRKCGAPVRVLDPAPAGERTPVVRVGPTAPALIAGAAAPLATGAAAVAAGALVRFALRRALRGLVAGGTRPARDPRRERRGAERAPTIRTVHITEVYRYRRVVRS
jgi:hypothetical protein